MALPSFNGVGRLTAPPEIRFTPAGMAVCTVNLAFNSRRFNKQSQEWEDGDVFFIRATAFKQLAENMADSLDRGTEVAVSGRLKTEQWTDKQSGDKRSASSLLLDACAPNLAYATAKVNKVSRSAGDTSGGSEDPWNAGPASQPIADEAPF